MTSVLERYVPIVGAEVIDHLRHLAEPLRGMKVVHVNSTREGGGVAEILSWLIPFKRELGLDARWEVISGEKDFYQCTKSFHNGLQGTPVALPSSLLRAYEQTNRDNAERLRPLLEDADFVFIHDPQPAPLLRLCPGRKGKWVWRCHIDLSHPYRAVWKYLRDVVAGYDASIWSLADFAQPLPHPLYLIAPSIDPLSQKNRELYPGEVEAVFDRYGLDPDLPLITQVSRFDRFKDPLGVLHAYRLVKEFTPVQLVLAGGGASDDPEGEEVLREVREAAGDDPDIHILLLPADAHREINGLQRASTIVLQKSTREGFGLTVTEAMWKGKPVIGGDTGGIRLQVINHHTGFLVNTPEGAALRIRYLLKNRDRLEEMGRKAQSFALNNFLVTRHLREYLTLMIATRHKGVERIEL
ncbi:trehalose synthase (ADP-glucose) [Desulfobulbus propionicus DSM 2032]|uniref:Trehalose synthase (ADP-glucose) n=1 Tax=Desulfobulbus propionicus (strain ATCC 33891 / DSM 2032 / VKM B-1956 / 1pr3) TaxID=577650 RepID=A0A7U4DPG4_DESPD|nr:glycosyltransferase [Desulfobulbus propionicus]ADW18037.1 trehalose synthase (ADP-glucose) [Desulfobulbus propionicus DSM 2032]